MLLQDDRPILINKVVLRSQITCVRRVWAFEVSRMNDVKKGVSKKGSFGMTHSP